MMIYTIFALFALAENPYRTPDEKGEGGVVVYKPEKCYNGYTLFCRNRGDRFYLIDMEGNMVHTWNPVSSIHFAELLPNGNLFYSTADRADDEENQGVHELDWESNEVWWYKCHVDHDHKRLENGNSMMLCREEVNRPEIYEEGPIFSPFYIEVTPKKEIVWEWHGYDHIEELKKLVGIKFPRDEKDWAHDNTMNALPDTALGRDDKRFRAGNIMFSFRNIDTIGIIDRKTKEIVWAWGPGVLDRQHMPNMLPNGHILIFDNGTHRKYSRILEIEPRTGKILWNYTADPPESFFSSAVSGQQRLPNGNTLICSGGQGRIFEVTMEGEIVWDYINPYRMKGKNANSLYRHSGRYAPEFIEKFYLR